MLIRLSLLLTLACGVLPATLGCATNPFVRFEAMDRLDDDLEAKAPDDRPLTILVYADNSEDFPLAKALAADDLSSYISSIRKRFPGHWGDVLPFLYQQEVEAPLAAAFNTLVQAELIYFLNRQFPNATLVAASRSIAEAVEGLKHGSDDFSDIATFQPREAGFGWTVDHRFPDSFPIEADIILEVDQDVRSTAYWATNIGGTFGRHLKIHVVGYDGATGARFFHTSLGGRDVVKVDADYASSLREPLEKRDLERAHENLRTLDRMTRYDHRRPITWRPPTSRSRRVVEQHARLLRANERFDPKHATYQTSTKQLEAYTGDPNTSVFAPLHRWVVAGVAEHVASVDMDARRERNFQRWARFYLDGGDAQLASSGTEDPQLRRKPKAVREAENKFLRRMTELTFLEPAAGEFGDIARATPSSRPASSTPTSAASGGRRSSPSSAWPAAPPP